MLLTNYAARIIARQKKRLGSRLLTNAAALLAEGLLEPRLDMPLSIFYDIVMTLLCFTISPSPTSYLLPETKQFNHTRSNLASRLAIQN
jgi:hypothetical protein